MFRAHHLELVRLAPLLAGDQASAEDAVKDVFTRLHPRWDLLASRAEPLAYLRAAAVNGCRSVHRRRRVARRHAVTGDLDAVAESAEAAALLGEDRRQVLDALALLLPRRREVLVLRYYAGLSVAEIASVLGVSPGTVKSATARGLATLANKLGEDR